MPDLECPYQTISEKRDISILSSLEILSTSHQLGGKQFVLVFSFTTTNEKTLLWRGQKEDGENKCAFEIRRRPCVVVIYASFPSSSGRYCVVLPCGFQPEDKK